MKQTIDFFIELVKYRRFLSLTLLISMVISIIIVFIIPVSYTANVAIVPPEGSKQSLLSSLTSISKLSSGMNLGGFSAMTVDLYSDLLRSDIVVDSIIIERNLMEQWGLKSILLTRKKLKRSTKLNITTSEMLCLSYTNTDPEFAALICDDYIMYLNKAMSYLDKLKLKNQLEMLNELYEEQINVVEKLNNEYILWQKKTNVESLENSAMQKNSAITMLYSKLAEEQLDYFMFKQDHPKESKTLKTQIALIKSIQNAIDETLLKIQSNPIDVVKYNQIMVELESAVIMKEEILGRINYVKSEISSTGNKIYTLGNANIPDIKSFPPRKSIVIIVILLILMLDILIIGIRYYLKTSLTEEQRNTLSNSMKKVFNDPFQTRKH
ncbi:hypothetical protein KAU15_06670 [candidate division WOR-3 bacterium]|nr:hypothetical protein [candidate division WOR-3 bacterium]